MTVDKHRPFSAFYSGIFSSWRVLVTSITDQAAQSQNRGLGRIQDYWTTSK